MESKVKIKVFFFIIQYHILYSILFQMIAYVISCEALVEYFVLTCEHMLELNKKDS